MIDNETNSEAETYIKMLTAVYSSSFEDPSSFSSSSSSSFFVLGFLLDA